MFYNIVPEVVADTADHLWSKNERTKERIDAAALSKRFVPEYKKQG